MPSLLLCSFRFCDSSCNTALKWPTLPFPFWSVFLLMLIHIPYTVTKAQEKTLSSCIHLNDSLEFKLMHMLLSPFFSLMFTSLGGKLIVKHSQGTHQIVKKN
jgi:hypothetical protein